jgi:hypothetical protein
LGFGHRANDGDGENDCDGNVAKRTAVNKWVERRLDFPRGRQGFGFI